MNARAEVEREGEHDSERRVGESEYKGARECPGEGTAIVPKGGGAQGRDR